MLRTNRAGASVLTGAAAGRTDAGPPVLPVPLGPQGLDLVHGRGAPHAVEALTRAAVRQGAVGARGVRVEAEAVACHNARGGLVEWPDQVGRDPREGGGCL